jgi:hypothetical protein
MDAGDDEAQTQEAQTGKNKEFPQGNTQDTTTFQYYPF